MEKVRVVKIIRGSSKSTILGNVEVIEGKSFPFETTERKYSQAFIKTNLWVKNDTGGPERKKKQIKEWKLSQLLALVYRLKTKQEQGI